MRDSVNWMEKDRDYLERLKSMDKEYRKAYMMGDPTELCLHPQEVKITNEYLRKEKQLEVLYCPLDTPYGPMPATSEQHRQYNREMVRASSRICIKYEIKRELLTKIVRLNRTNYE